MFSNYRPLMFSLTWEVTCLVTLPADKVCVFVLVHVMYKPEKVKIFWLGFKVLLLLCGLTVKT